MIVIREAQMRAFAVLAEERFVADTAAYLREQHGSKKIRWGTSATRVIAIAEPKLKSMVRIGMDRAARLGLNSRSSLMAYIVTMFLTAPNFDEHPAVRSVLTDGSIDAERRMEELWKRTVDEDWIAVRASYDATAWEAHSRTHV